MPSGIIGMLRLSQDLEAYVRIWDSLYIIWNYWNAAFVSIVISICKDMESFHVIRNYWNAARVSIFTSICNDMGVISCHPELLECSVCLDIYNHMQGYGNYWNAALFLIFTSICKDMGAFHVIQNYWNAGFFFVFTSICKGTGIILYHPK